MTFHFLRRRRFATIDEAHKRILRAALWSSLFVSLAKLAGAIKEMAVAWRYGVSGLVDAYQLALTYSYWLPGTLVSMLGIVLVPMLVQRREVKRDIATLLNGTAGAAWLVGIMLYAICVIAGQPLLARMSGGLSEGTKQLAWRYVLWMAPTIPIALQIGLSSARLIAQERQSNTLLEGLPAITIVVFMLVAPTEWIFAPLAVGTICGLVIQQLVASRLASKADGLRLRPTFTPQQDVWRDLYRAGAAVIGGQLVMSLILPLDQYCASRLGEGAIATLGYANRLASLLLGLGAVAIARATLPVIADLRANQTPGRARNIAFRWTAIMFSCGVVVSAVSWTIAPNVVALLFQRGAFSAADTLRVALVFRWGLIQVPVYFAGLVLVQLLAAEGRFREIGLLAGTNLVIKIAFNILLPPLMGVSGIAASTGVMYVWALLSLIWVSSRGKR